MARNQEKAKSMLFRFREVMNNEAGLNLKKKRPYMASECTDLTECERWRIQIIHEIGNKISQIQNVSLGEYRTRDLNDEINKLLREKRHWERQILELGGPDHFRTGPKPVDEEGKELPGSRGYKYFGAARNLPGVRELFDKVCVLFLCFVVAGLLISYVCFVLQADKFDPKSKRENIYRKTDAEYYGFLDNYEADLLPLEEAAEKFAITQALAKLNYTERDAFAAL
eukprot:Sdes_comp16647_c0_seq2m5944